jgi:alcohol dehydrogenase class IV
LALLRSAANAGIAAREGASVHGAPVGLARETGEALSERSPVLYATCVALMLPFAIAYSRRDCTERIARIACAFEIPMTNDIVETADRVIAAIRALGQAGGLPSNFRKAGISRAAMEGAARAIAASPSALNFVRPVANVEQMMNEVFRFAW